jgi:hypothetical protein
MHCFLGLQGVKLKVLNASFFRRLEAKLNFKVKNLQFIQCEAYRQSSNGTILGVNA